jgi:hypothetical protein
VPFDSAVEVTQAIAADPRFQSCIAKQVLTFALGRHTQEDDQPLLEELGRKFADSGFLIPSLIEFVATSPAMMQRKAEQE